MCKDIGSRNTEFFVVILAHHCGRRKKEKNEDLYSQESDFTR